MGDIAITGDGVIHKSVQYQVWCVDCDRMLDYTEYQNQVEAIEDYRQQGWHHTKNGWQCPNHGRIMITEHELQEIEKMLGEISPYPWQCEKTGPGEWWITSPDDSDHEYRENNEPIYESSGTIPQFGIDGKFIAQAPEIIGRFIIEIRRLTGLLNAAV